MSDIKTDDIQDSTEPAPTDALDVDELDNVSGGVLREIVHAPSQPKL